MCFRAPLAIDAGHRIDDPPRLQVLLKEAVPHHRPVPATGENCHGGRPLRPNKKRKTPNMPGVEEKRRVPAYIGLINFQDMTFQEDPFYSVHVLLKQ